MPHKQNFVLNDKEKSVLDAFGKIKTNGTNLVSLSDLASAAFGKRKKGTSPKTKGNSWVRNSLRRLLRFGLVGYHGKRSGLYFRTDVELADLIKKAEADAAAKVAAKTAKKAKTVKASKKTESSNLQA